MALATPTAPRRGIALLSIGEPPHGDQLVHRAYEEAVPARLVPLPEDLDPRIVSALIGQGIAELYTHQAETYELARAGKHVCVVTGTASGKSLAYTLPLVQELLETPGARSLYLSPDEGARAGPGATLSASCGSGCDRRCTTATRRANGDRSRASGAIRSSRTRTCCTSGSSRTTRAGPRCCAASRTSSSTRRTSTAASSAATWRSCCAVYAGVCATVRREPDVPARVGDGRQSRRARARADGPRGDRRLARTARRGPRAPSRSGSRRCSMTRRASAARPSPRRRCCSPTLVTAGLRTICFIRSRRGGRDRLPDRARDAASAARRPTSPNGSRPTAPATRPRSGARSSATSSRASCSASPRRTPSSSASTSGCSTARSPSASPARSRACDSSGDAPGAAARVSPCTCRPPTGSTVSSHAIPRRCCAARSRLRCSIPRARRSGSGTCAPPRTSRRSRRRTTPCSAPARTTPRVELERAGELVRTPAGLAWRAGDSPAAAVSLRSASPEAILIVDETSGTILGAADAARALWTLHEGAVYLHRGESHLVRQLDLARAGRPRRPARAALVHAASPRHVDDDPLARAARRSARASSSRTGRSRSSTRWSPTSVDRCPSTGRSISCRSSCRSGGSRRPRSGSSRRTSCSRRRAATCSGRCMPPSTR